MMEKKEKRREAVKVENLKKSYGDRQVLKGVSFQVGRGEIFGVLGGERSRQDHAAGMSGRLQAV